MKAKRKGGRSTGGSSAASGQSKPNDLTTAVGGSPSGWGFQWLVCLATFTAGASIMAVELAGSRLLSPLFGNTIYNWTGLIGVVLAAMACGAFLFGYLSDRMEPIGVMTGLFAGAGIWVLAIPSLNASIGSLFSPRSIQWGPIISSMVLFAFPAGLLAGVTPAAVKAFSRGQMGGLGRKVGFLSALATVGSLVGTFGTTFVLIPNISVRLLFVGIGLILLGLSLLSALVLAGMLKARGRRTTGKVGVVGAAMPVGLLALLIIFASTGSQSDADNMPPGGKILFQQETPYHRVRVTQVDAKEKSARLLYLDTTLEGGRFEGERWQDHLLMEYTAYYRLWPVFMQQAQSALFIGGGGYAMPLSMWRNVPGALVEVVEIDPVVQEVGHLFFDLPREAPRLKAHVGDARRFLMDTPHHYDLIFGDAYSGIHTVPYHLVTEEFFHLVRERLTPNGIFMMNLIGARKGPAASLYRSVARTLLHVFQELHLFQVGDGGGRATQNLVLVGLPQKLELSRDEMEARAVEAGQDHLMTGSYVGRITMEEVMDVEAGQRKPLLLTDDYSPVEVLVAGDLSHLDAL